MNQKTHIAIGLLVRIDDVNKIVEEARRVAFVKGICPSIRAAKRAYTKHNLPECMELLLRPDMVPTGCTVMESAATEFEPP